MLSIWRSPLRMLAAMAVGVALASGPAAAQQTGGPYARSGSWVLLGQKSVGFGVDRDVIEVGRAEGRFRSLKLIVRGADIFLVDLKVVYASGEADDLSVKRPIRAGTETEEFDLKGRARSIQRVEMVYRTRPGFEGRATVEVWAVQHAPPRQDAIPAGYTELDVRPVRLSDPVVRLPVGFKEGRHRVIRLRALDDQVFIRRLEIIYGNDQRSEIRINDALAPGEMTQNIDLEGDRRFVKEVIVHLRPQQGGRIARLQLLGDQVGASQAPPPPPPPTNGHGLNQVPQGWIMFGSQTVGFGVERDVIRVGGSVGVFDKIALRVHNNDVFVREIDVVFAGGETQKIAINAPIRAGMLTRPIDITGERRIREIHLIYQARPGFRGQAVVEVYGEYAQGWLGGGRRDWNGGWVLLGAQRASMLRSDSDIFSVGRRYGAFRSISFKAQGNDVRIRWVRVTYSGGEVEELPINIEVRNGGTSAPFPLAGRGDRHIESVQVNYRAELNLRGDATVELWGQH